jgi:hypothetical protein
MKNVLFVISHLFSGSTDLLAVLNEHDRIHINDNTRIPYEHPSVLDNLFSLGHKLDNSAAIYGDHLLFNTDFNCTAFYDFSKFIYVVRHAKPTLNEIKNQRKEYSDLSANRYYCFRLRRIYEMARRTPGAVLLTGDNLRDKKGAELVTDYLNLTKPVDFSNLLYINYIEENVASPIVEDAQDCYEKYLYNLRQLDLRKI